ncbi:lipopolysaccharide kinase InaA family protein [Altibacter sp. HG106]|uniref:lipopolysaccharide kinase InaA family protein n=1 Tax=Altibacter sp. HG106 TaxID=3023937 RepID=UPI0023501BFB|nr:lipopolysaccharide kinase InaA family protein [Altibacter sp. HG106]MDC7993953.1 lipopolysaccharide kinase InaA family protein [Altibacter sp. HG106]
MKETFRVHPDFKSIAPEIQTAINSFETAGEFLVEEGRNQIKKIAIEGTYYTFKKFKTPNAFQRWVYQYFRKSKAKRSYEYAIRLIESGIKTPFPVAYQECFDGGLRESFYISRYVDYDLDFRVLNHNPNYPRRKEILAQFAAFTFELHEKEINFLDHSPGNTLILNKEDNTYDFYLIDLNRMRFEKMSLEKRMKNFRRLWLSKTMINIMAPVYAKLYGATSEKIHELMTAYSRAFQKKGNAKKLRRRKRKRNG